MLSVYVASLDPQPAMLPRIPALGKAGFSPVFRTGRRHGPGPTAGGALGSLVPAPRLDGGVWEAAQPVRGLLLQALL